MTELTSLLSSKFPLRLALVSPPRTGSTLLARILWQHPDVTHHCHEPFEAGYWGGAGRESVDTLLSNPLDLRSGNRIALEAVDGRGLLLKEMTFQADRAQFLFLARLSTRPVIFVVRDPRLSATSRLRIVKELKGAVSFPPFESGWPSLAAHVETCRKESVPYVIVDSDMLRKEPWPVIAALEERLDIGLDARVLSWEARPGMQLCAPEVGTLMGEGRAGNDPFYRRVLASSGVQPIDPVDLREEESRLAEAGLSEHVKQWTDIYRTLLDDPNLVAPSS